MSVLEPQPDPETLEALLDTTWRLATAETARTDALDRKAATVASFASIVGALTSTLGIRFVEQLDSWWALVPFVTGLAALVGSVLCAAVGLWPREFSTLGTMYLRGFVTWRELLKGPVQVRGETMAGLVDAIARERVTNARKVGFVRWAFVLLAIGVGLTALESATLAIDEVTR